MEVIHSQMKKQMKKMAEETSKEFNKMLEIVVEKLVSQGWTLPPELTIYQLNMFGKVNDIENINIFLKEYFSRDNYEITQRMVNGILESKIKEGLKKMIVECWVAFQHHLFAICSTSLVSVVEGVLSEFSEDKTDIRMMRVCQKQVDKFPFEGDIIEKHVWISYNLFIRNLYEKSNFNEAEPQEVNRHWLLHGRSDFEIDDLDCIRLFNAIATLCMIVNKHKEEVCVEGQK